MLLESYDYMSQENKKKNKRKMLLQIHKIVGLGTGLVVFIVAITGCFWAFKEEIDGLYDTYKYVVPKIDQDFIAASEVKKIAEDHIPDKTIHGVVYGRPNEAVEVVFYQTTPELFYQSLFLNPYSGVVIKRVDNNAGFFAFVLKGHLRLWLPEGIGSRVVSYSILLFLGMLISGLILWYPRNKKNKKHWKQRLQFDWNSKTRWKRKNFDLHTVTGFYISSLGLVLAFTGCVMAFNWFYFIAYKVTGGDKAPQFIIPNSEQVFVAGSLKKQKYDALIPMLYAENPDVKNVELHYPENDTTSILVEVSNSKGLYYDMDYRFFDQTTLKELATTSIYGKYEDAHFADKVIRMNYDIHIGAIGGIAGKIIAFVVSLICATLPVSGVLLWYGRRYK